MNDTVQTPGSSGELRKSLHDMASAAEALLRATVDETNAEYRRARTALDDTLRAARSSIAGQAHEFASDARQIGAQGERLVRDNPWVSVGIGAGVGLLLGLVLRRR